MADFSLMLFLVVVADLEAVLVARGARIMLLALSSLSAVNLMGWSKLRAGRAACDDRRWTHEQFSVQLNLFVRVAGASVHSKLSRRVKSTEEKFVLRVVRARQCV